MDEHGVEQTGLLVGNNHDGLRHADALRPFHRRGPALALLQVELAFLVDPMAGLLAEQVLGAVDLDTGIAGFACGVIGQMLVFCRFVRVMLLRHDDAEALLRRHELDGYPRLRIIEWNDMLDRMQETRLYARGRGVEIDAQDNEE